MTTIPFDQELKLSKREWDYFKNRHPDIASRLTSEASDDGSVRLLLEAVSFLAADIRRRTKEGWSSLRSELLSELFPNFTAPIPCVLTLEISGIEESRLVDSTSVFRSASSEEFRLSGQQTLFPLQVEKTQLLNQLPDDYPRDISAGGNAWVKATLTGNFAETASELDALGINRLRVYVNGSDQQLLHHAILHPSTRVYALHNGKLLDAALTLQRSGLTSDDNVVTPPPRSFSGYWILQEYFLFPERFCYFEIEGINDVFDQLGPDAREFEMFFSVSANSVSTLRAELKTNCLIVANLRDRREVIRISGKTGAEELPLAQWGNDVGVYDVQNVERYESGDWVRLPHTLSGRSGATSWLYRPKMNEQWGGQLSVRDNTAEDKDVRVSIRSVSLTAARGLVQGSDLSFSSDHSVKCNVLHVSPCLIPPFASNDSETLQSLITVSRLPANNQRAASALRQQLRALSRYAWVPYGNGVEGVSPNATRVLSEIDGITSVEVEYLGPYELRIILKLDSASYAGAAFSNFAAVISRYFSWGRTLNTAVELIARAEDGSQEFIFTEKPNNA